MDDNDLKALKYLSQNGRASWSELAGILRLSAPSAAERVRRLEESGVIKGYCALVDSQAVGLGITAFVNVILGAEADRSNFLQLVQSNENILECHHVTGDFDYQLKIRCKSTSELEAIINSELKAVAKVARSQTIIALSTAKEVSSLPLETAEILETNRA